MTKIKRNLKITNFKENPLNLPKRIKKHFTTQIFKEVFK
jgi:hypothetical protein